MKTNNRFFLIGTTGAVMMAVALVAWAEGPGQQWALAHDVQKYYRCLPFKWYAVRAVETGTMPQRGELIQFRSPSHVERFTGQFELIKIAVALEGDEWMIADGQVSVNGSRWADMHLIETLGLPADHLQGQWVVPKGHVLVMGTNPSSYDSRYWGPLPIENITGKAYALL